MNNRKLLALQIKLKTKNRKLKTSIKKNLKKQVITTSLIILTLCLISCKSNKVEYKYKVIYPRLDLIDYPDSKGKLIPLDKNKEVVTDNGTPIVYVLSDFNFFVKTVEFKSNYDAIREEYNNFIINAKKLEIELNSK